MYGFALRLQTMREMWNHILMCVVFNAAQYFLDVGHAQAMIDNKVLTELTSGCCFGEMAFLATCNKVLRRRNCKDELATRVCDGKTAFALPCCCLTRLAELTGYGVTVRSVEVTRVLELTVRDFLFVVEPRENVELQDALAGTFVQLALCALNGFGKYLKLLVRQISTSPHNVIA